MCHASISSLMYFACLLNEHTLLVRVLLAAATDDSEVLVLSSLEISLAHMISNNLSSLTLSLAALHLEHLASKVPISSALNKEHRGRMWEIFVD